MAIKDVTARRKAAKDFASKWSKIKREKQYAQSFWSDFLRYVVGVEDLLAAGVEFEYPVRSSTTNTIQFIDVLWSGIVLIEHKSAGKSLDAAEKQARDYLVSLPSHDRAPFLIISDFATIRIIDVFQGTTSEFALDELPANLHRVEAVFGEYDKNATINEIVADRDAAVLMGDLFETFEKAGYTGHHVSVFLVRVLFLLFGDDTYMWKKKGRFQEIVEATRPDGSDVGSRLQELFYVLAHEERPPHTDPLLAAFPYVNGGLYDNKDDLPFFKFTPEMREALLKACHYDWSGISPAVFGAMFQTVKSKEERRALGEHYTSEQNILKLIRPLFLDDYLDRLRKVWDDVKGLRELRKSLGERNYIDPACGSGNFLIVAYKRLRDIELKILARLQELEGTQGQVGLEIANADNVGVVVKLTQFHGIEYEEWSSQIATVAMYLADRQANLAMDEVLGSSPNRFPLKESAKIVRGNALRLDWAEVCPMDDNTIIMGNPPFYGSTNLNAEQKQDVALVWKGLSGSGILDYVASWYLVAARHIEGTKAVAAFVSTNSITQGQQPAVIWNVLYQLGAAIDFAHRTFRWRNAGGKEASVYVVIVGISWHGDTPKKGKRSLWSYETVNSDPELVAVDNINAYLLDAPNLLIRSRSKPLRADSPPMTNGNKPVDNNLLSKISAEDAARIRANDPIAAKYLRRVVGSEELINGIERWGLWMVGVDPNDLLNSPVLKERVEAVRAFRAASTKLATQKDADRAWEWQQINRQPTVDFLGVPRHSSHDRDYTPFEFLTPDFVPNDALSCVIGASTETFGVMSSKVFSVWNKAVSGRLKEDPRISSEITYNNFPFPVYTDDARKKAVTVAAEKVLEARAQFPDSTLATLYNRAVMPTVLRKAHADLDKAVLNAYGLRTNTSEVGILETLFNLYESVTAGLLAAAPKKRQRR
ncbi:DNA methyltransferase [Microbacterium sp. p3-SID336]|uniref:DNA methyltransferase n=1 Tax=Microbacterium sp. p3-SID336 TaxID=2916212 RepID=UPI0021A28709|nr:DNA methyltransferase [Microbacterium sp. p3-SID336]MCT1478312.1 class I SAM-dependent DNA methyltransferase [Microbacterium sp. p3-SID336]